MQLNFQGLEMQLWNIPRDRAQEVVWAKYLSAPERSYWGFSENVMVNRLWSYRLWDIEGRNVKKLMSQQKIP